MGRGHLIILISTLGLSCFAKRFDCFDYIHALQTGVETTHYQEITGAHATELERALKPISSKYFALVSMERDGKRGYLLYAPGYRIFFENYDSFGVFYRHVTSEPPRPVFLKDRKFESLMNLERYMGSKMSDGTPIHRREFFPEMKDEIRELLAGVPVESLKIVRYWPVAGRGDYFVILPDQQIRFWTLNDIYSVLPKGFQVSIEEITEDQVFYSRVAEIQESIAH